jgi:hypothetical protein
MTKAEFLIKAQQVSRKPLAKHSVLLIKTAAVISPAVQLAVAIQAAALKKAK